MPSRDAQAGPRARRRDRDGIVALARNTLHAAALVFAAFWLMATSTVEEGGSSSCYRDVQPFDVLRVEVGPSTGTAAATCGDIDGLMKGTNLSIQLGWWAESQTGCSSLSTNALSGATGVTLTMGEGVPLQGELTFATGTFQSPTVPGCRGEWRLTLDPVADPFAGGAVSPLDAGPAQPWRVTRSIAATSDRACASLFPSSGRQPAMCKDTFEVERITKEEKQP